MDVNNCGFISHTPLRFDFGWDEEDEQCMVLKQVMLQQIQLLRSQGCKSFYVVPDSGAGLWFGEMVNILRNEDSDLMLQCILPHEELSTKWYPELRQRYFTLLEQCTHLMVVSRPDDELAVEKALRYMVKCCDLILTVYSPRLRENDAVDRVMTELGESMKPILQIEPGTLELRLFGVKNK